jgi:hypothetical protein
MLIADESPELIPGGVPGEEAAGPPARRDLYGQNREEMAAR